MIYIIVGFLCGFEICGLVLRCVNAKFTDCVRGDNFFHSLAIGLFISSALIACLLLTEPDADYITDSKNYALKEVHKNQYYISNTDGNSVSVWIMDGMELKKITFPEDKVKFLYTSGEANAQIKFKKIQEPSIMEIFWFLKGCKVGQKKILYESAVIEIPEETESRKVRPLIKENSQNENIAVESKKNFCDECGSKVEATSKFCSQCGKQL